MLFAGVGSGSLPWERAQPLLHSVSAAPLSAATASTGSKIEGDPFR